MGDVVFRSLPRGQSVFGGVNLDSYWVTMPSGLSYYIAGQDHIPLIRGEGGFVK